MPPAIEFLIYAVAALIVLWVILWAFTGIAFVFVFVKGELDERKRAKKREAR